MKKLQIKAPCSENWNKMQGNNQKRYCASCDHHVENFTDKYIEEIVGILENREGRTCGRLRASQLNPVRKIAAAVMFGAMLAGCQPEVNVLGEISAPPPIEIDTTEQEKPENETVNSSKYLEKEGDTSLKDTASCEGKLMGIM